MTSILDSLKSISGYPVPENVFATIAIKRGIRLTYDSTPKVLQSSPYRLAKADVMMWVANAPDVKQLDVSYNLTDEQRRELRKAANAIYEELEDDAFIPDKAKFGYKGDRL